MAKFEDRFCEAAQAGYLYTFCPACNRPPHEKPLRADCRRCGGYGYLTIKDFRLGRTTLERLTPTANDSRGS